jgi:hypothetical protein
MKKLIIFLTALLISELIFAQSLDMNLITVGNYDEKVINDPTIDYTRFKTFSVISANVLFDNKSLTLEEKQIDFFIRNEESALKLRNVSIKDSIKPDLLFVYDYSNDYKEKYIAPRTYSFPIWSSGGTTTINSNSNTNLNTYGDLNVTGNIYGNKTTTISNSGKWDITSVQRPAYTVGQFFPNFSLTIYDTSDNTKIWEGNANGTSTQKDGRFAAQYLILTLFNKVPQGSYINPDFLVDNNGYTGIQFSIFNTNGLSFYPTTVGNIENSPAKSIGLKDWDVILSINGETTANKSEKQINEMLRGNAGTKIDLLIERKGKQIKKSLVKRPR